MGNNQSMYPSKALDFTNPTAVFCFSSGVEWAAGLTRPILGPRGCAPPGGPGAQKRSGRFCGLSAVGLAAAKAAGLDSGPSMALTLRAPIRRPKTLQAFWALAIAPALPAFPPSLAVNPALLVRNPAASTSTKKKASRIARLYGVGGGGGI